MSELKPPFAGFLALEGWAGKTYQPVNVIGETPKRYRIECPTKWPVQLPRRFLDPGQTALVPKHSITYGDRE